MEEEPMPDETQNKIIEAAMNLIMERGYSATTTKDIAAKAGVNECTIFRRFQGKKDIVLLAMQLPKWNPNLSEADFSYTGDVEQDLVSFSELYMKKVTPRMVKISIGLRTSELFPDTAEGILKVPQVFKKVLEQYFQEMYQAGKIHDPEYENLAMMFLSMNFGFVFLNASFGKKLTKLKREEYIKSSIRVFLNGIC
jgi:AcrR family transcriptional regulator